MRRVFAIFALAAGTLRAFAAIPPASPNLTVVLDFKRPLHDRAVFEMEREAGGILSRAGMHLDWRSRSTAVAEPVTDLVVFTFKGDCAVTPEAAPPLYDELGPLAVTRTLDGAVQPFGEVDCNRVAASIRSAMWGGDFARSDELMGRALGRVVAHELVHMLTRSGVHSRFGVEERALSGRDLITGSLPLSSLDLDRLRRRSANR